MGFLLMRGAGAAAPAFEVAWFSITYATSDFCYFLSAAEK